MTYTGHVLMSLDTLGALSYISSIIFYFMSFDCSVLTAAQLCSECECIYQQLGQFREEIGVDE